MKKYGYIYEKIWDMDNLRLAHKNARKDKLYYREVKMVDNNPDYYLSQIQEMLKTETYEVSPYSVSVINDKGKERELMKLPYFPDRIIQWAIMLQIEKIFMNVFVSSTCASLSGRGIHTASAIIRKSLKNDPEGTKYCYKIDVKHFYPSINHSILKKLLRKKFKDKKLLRLLDKIIDSSGGTKGIPIGSYLSQYLANYYLAYFDHWVKEYLGVKYYVRYMDDIVILSGSKERLHDIHNKVTDYFSRFLELTIKENWQIFPTGVRGIDFVGYRHFYNFQLLRKGTYKRFRRKMLKIKRKMKKQKPVNLKDWSAFNSYHGWLLWCNSYNLRKKYLMPISGWVERYYIEQIKGGAVNDNKGKCDRKRGAGKAVDSRSVNSLCA